MWVAIGLLAGGALGNLADRVRIDAVTDFIDLPAWPPFNLADVAITARGRDAGLDLPARGASAERVRAANRLRRRGAGGGRQAGRPGRPSGALAPGRDPGRPARRPARRRRGPRAARDRPPARQGDQRPAGRRRAPTRRCRALQAAGRRREVERVYLALAAGRLELAHRDDRRADRPRSARQRHRMAVSGAASREARTHFEVLELLRRRQLPRGAAGDRPHAPDPRPLRRHRAPAGRRPDLRRPGAARARAPVPARPPARLRASRRRRAAAASTPTLPDGPAAGPEQARDG